jgi:serine/threonine-protein kinase
MGSHFFTMELVSGKSIAELLPKKGFSPERFFEIAVPLADAVAAAHDRGIVLRDLKPSNLMWADEHRLKVLDFGLARAFPGAAGLASELPTEAKTGEGVIVGTVSYMSPEQAEGKTASPSTEPSIFPAWIGSRAGLPMALRSLSPVERGGRLIRARTT